ncbi:MAG: glycosyltransferase family 4 protein, partial [Thermoguttaceae bacterium]|nr:glycosyltransferase family 4 protein [Thermoguttaceae bacterium]
WNPGIIKRLRRKGYDAIILGGYNHFTMLAAAWYARRNHIPYYLMNEVFLRQPRAVWKRLLKEPFLRQLFRGAAGGLPTGTLAREYLTHYGLKEDRICFVPNSPDIDGLTTAARDLWTKPKASLRSTLGLKPEPMVLFVGRFIARKNVDKLILAFQRLNSQIPVQLVLVGSGPAERDLRRMLNGERGNLPVYFPGFVQPRELPHWYAAADVFALPSWSETWGVVVLEALSCGCPVVLSDMVGCGPDVVNCPEVGKIVPANDVDALAAALKEFLLNPRPREQVTEMWRPVAEKMKYDVVARRLVEFLRRTATTK